jgi:hypothetical protein
MAKRIDVDREQINEVNGGLDGVIDGIQYCKFGEWTSKPKIRTKEVVIDPVECHSEYSKQLIGHCKFGSWKNGKMWCNCTRDCAECTVGGRGTYVGIPMRPELYKARLEEKMQINFKKSKSSGVGLMKTLRDKKAKKERKDGEID